MKYLKKIIENNSEKIKHNIVILIYLKDRDSVIVRKEPINGFYKNTLISGTIEENEKPIEALYRELKEEVGIIINNNVNIDINKLSKSKANLENYYYSIINLDKDDYSFLDNVETDGSIFEHFSENYLIKKDKLKKNDFTILIDNFIINKFLGE